MLLEVGFDLNKYSKYYNPSLLVAASNNSTPDEIYKILLEGGANINFTGDKN